MVLNEQEVGDIYLTVKDVLMRSEFYDDGIIPTIYTLLIKELFNELPILSCRCKVLKSQYLIGQVSIGQKERHKNINYYNQDAYYTEDMAINTLGNILNRTIGLSESDRHIFSDSEGEIYSMDFIIAPTFDSFGDRDLYYIFKAFQMYSHDVVYDKSGYCYDVFRKLISCIFEDFESFIRMWNENNHIYCIFNNTMEENIARNTLINYFGFEEDKNLVICPYGFHISPIDYTNYSLYWEG